MSSGKNILNAFTVVAQTYHNISSMFDELDEIAENNKAENIVSNTPHFLRWKSDSNVGGWLIHSFTKLYQKIDIDRISENMVMGNGPIYAFEVFFGESSFSDSPEVILSKFEYNKEPLNGKSPSISDHWLFYYPTRVGKEFKQSNKGGFTIAKPNSSAASNKFKGLKQATFKRIKLMDITADNLDEIFKELLAI